MAETLSDADLPKPPVINLPVAPHDKYGSGRPITDPAFFQFNEFIFSKDDALCAQLVRPKENESQEKSVIVFPDWKPANNVIQFQWGGKLRTIGYWDVMDVDNNGEKLVLYGQYAGIHGQTFSILKISQDQFLGRYWHRGDIGEIQREFISFGVGTAIMPIPKNVYYLDYDAREELRKRNLDFGFYSFENMYISPFFYKGKTYFIGKFFADQKDKDNHIQGGERDIDGMVFVYHGYGQIEDLCYYVN